MLRAFDHRHVLRIDGQQFHQSRTVAPEWLGIFNRDAQTVLPVTVEKTAQELDVSGAFESEFRQVGIENGECLRRQLQNFKERTVVLGPACDQFGVHFISSHVLLPDGE